MDIVKRLAPEGVNERFPRVGAGYAELTIRRRQAGEDREDLQLAEWFSGSPIAPGEDDVFDKVVRTGQSEHVRFVQWDSADEVLSKIIDVLVEEHFYRSLHEMYPVMDNMRLIGCVNSKQVAGIPRDQWKQLTVRDIVMPCSAENTVAADADARAALSIMNRTGTSRLLVLDGDRLAGIVTLKDLLKLFMLKLNLEGTR